MALSGMFDSSQSVFALDLKRNRYRGHAWLEFLMFFGKCRQRTNAGRTQHVEAFEARNAASLVRIGIDTDAEQRL